ncbi:MAG: dihydroneopterin aldolase [bacterium]
MNSSLRDKIYIRSLRANCIVGVHPQERITLQTITFDVELFKDLSKAAEADDLSQTVDYQQVAERIQLFAEESRFLLLEALAESTAALILREFEVEAVLVRVFKGKVVEKTEGVGVELYRERKV